MKKLSIKLKITLWFTIFMILLTVIIFALIALVSSSSTNNQTKGELIGLVDDNISEIDHDDGELDIDDDYVSFRNGVYCLVFYDTGEKYSGYSPYSQLETEPFEDGIVRSVKIGNESYLIYDRIVTFKRHDDIWIRGIVLESGNAITSSAVFHAVLISLPILIILASVGGYTIADRSLRPIKKISKTAEDIGISGDLSKRIDVDGNEDELHQLSEAFNRMFDRLETNFEAERHFTSDASHELRTPVSIILANCEYAFENASDKEELYETIGAIQKQGYRMSHLIESLLDFTRLEQKTESIAFDTIDISAIANAVINENKENSVRGISLTDAVQPNIMMKTDAGLFSRMLENLIQNAYKYGKDNGHINVSLVEEKNHIILTVEDDGIGIAENEQVKIWNRFYRADKSRSNTKGLGLGLSMVKQIAQLHNCNVDVKSELDKGSVFTIKFTKA